MDGIGLIITFVIVAAASTACIIFWLKSERQRDAAGFKLLQESFEGLQRNLLLGQKEFEKFQELRGSALRSEIAQELQSNRKELTQGLQNSGHSLEQKVKNLSDGVQTKLDLNLKEGFRHFEKVQEHLKQTEKQLSNLNNVGQSINDLNNLLRLPHLRGSFGEALLERILSDLLPTDAYELQYRVVPTSTERVDAVIKYPTCVLPIDSKFPREQVLPLFETQEPAKLEEARKNLTEVIKGLAKQIREKYIHPEHGTTEMALLFVPSETLYFEIIRNIRLCDELAKHKVFAVSPNTLGIMLHAITIARGYYEMAKGVEKTIEEVKRAQQHFDNFERRFEEIGAALTKAQTSFHTAATHLSRYGGAVSRLTGSEPANESAATETKQRLLPSEPSA